MHADLSSLFDLSGRVAIVTGGSRGLGRAMALGLAKAGASVVVASRKREACEGVVAEIAALDTKARGFAVAVRMQEADDIKGLVDTTIAEFGRIDIVINNAGTVLDRSLETLDPTAFVGALTTNLLGPLLLVQAARPHLAASGHGAVVNISSIAGFAGSRGRYLYPPAKAALAQATKSLALDLAAENIRVNAISPGTFRTDMVEKAFDDAMLGRIATAIPAGRIADPNEIVGPALLLVSDAGSFITGEVLTVDGGATA
jgi:NAD(P)-dependent dehydrogenase (short-subunit alcohol dehydrogenase family)